MSKGIMFIDLETENHEYYGAISSPRHPDNYVVMIGQAIDYSPYEGEITYKHYRNKEEAVDWLKIPDDVWLLVAHNFTFELDWILEQCYDEFAKFINRGGRIWCTQLGFYRLSRQQHIYPKLDEVAVHYGGNTKIDLVALEWERGKLTSEIDADLLRDYLIGTDKMEGDIGNTRIAFYGEYMEAEERGMLKAILKQNNGLLFNAVCENNGLKVDMEVAQKNLDALTDRIDIVKAGIMQGIADSGVTQEGIDVFNFGSDFHKSAVIYGGTYSFDAKVPSIDADGNPRYEKMDVVYDIFNKDWFVPWTDYVEGVLGTDFIPNTYKSGKRKGEIKVERIDSDKIKMINGKKQEILDGLIPLDLTPKFTKGVIIGYSVALRGYDPDFSESFVSKYTQDRELKCGTPVMSSSEDALLELIARPETSKEAKELLTLFREYAILNKVIGSFFDKQEYYANGNPKKRTGMFQFVTDRGLIHHSLNICATKTGRLSSTKP